MSRMATYCVPTLRRSIRYMLNNPAPSRSLRQGVSIVSDSWKAFADVPPDGLWVDEGVSLADPKAVIVDFLRRFSSVTIYRYVSALRSSCHRAVSIDARYRGWLGWAAYGSSQCAEKMSASIASNTLAFAFGIGF